MDDVIGLQYPSSSAISSAMARSWLGHGLIKDVEITAGNGGNGGNAAQTKVPFLFFLFFSFDTPFIILSNKNSMRPASRAFAAVALCVALAAVTALGGELDSVFIGGSDSGTCLFFFFFGCALLILVLGR